ncbi:MAG: Uncharacterized protein CEO12_298 [Parcubacteria group bacterium Gr01-1014_46]|nr:MAG: Uncharacterized protein CEO12_298 [Parcubacteria group bacterium Gr01-1014_46]
MDYIHNKISENVNWYRKWHDMDGPDLIHWLLFILVAVLAWSSINGQVYLWLNEISEQEIVVKLPNSNATLSLDPQTSTVRVGDVFTVNVILNTNEGSVDGVDIYGLHYDPSILEVIDDISKQKGVQIEPGKILPNNAVNSVNPSTGTIKLGQLSYGGEKFTGRGTLATIHFKAVGVGSSFLKFDFEKGSTIDTNAAYKGRDKLAKVVDAIYTVTEK